MDTANNLLHVGGQQGFDEEGNLPDDPAERVALAYENMYKIAAFYGASPLDVTRLMLFVGTESEALAEAYPDLDRTQRFSKCSGSNYLRCYSTRTR